METFKPLTMPHLDDLMQLYTDGKSKLGVKDEMRFKSMCTRCGWIDISMKKFDKFIKEESTKIANAHFTGQIMIPVANREKEIPQVTLKQLSQQGVIKCVREITCELLNGHRLVTINCLVTKISIKYCLFVTILLFQHSDDVELALPEYENIIAEQTKKREQARKYMRECEDSANTASKRRTNHDMHEYSDDDSDDDDKKKKNKSKKAVEEADEEEEEDGMELEINITDKHRVTKTPSIFIGYFFKSDSLDVDQLNKCINYHV